MQENLLLDEETEKEVSRLMALYDGFVSREGCLKMIEMEKKNKPKEQPKIENSLLLKELEKTTERAVEDSIKDIDAVRKTHPNTSTGDDIIDFQ